MSWKSALDGFLEHAGVTHPTAATKQDAIAYRSWLLGRLNPSTVKTQLAFMNGLFRFIQGSRLWLSICERRMGFYGQLSIRNQTNVGVAAYRNHAGK